MRSEICNAVLFLLAALQILVYASPSTDEFVVSGVYNLSDTASNNHAVIVSAGGGKICFAYRINTTTLAFGYGQPDAPAVEHLTIDPQSFFDVLVLSGSSPGNCIVFYTTPKPVSCYINSKVEGQSIVGPFDVLVSWDALHTMNVIPFPGSSTAYLLGFAFVISNDPKFGLARYEPTNSFASQISSGVTLGTSPKNNATNVNFFNYAAGNFSVAATLIDGSVWIGNMVSPSYSFSSRNSWSSSAVAVTSKPLSSGASGVLCYTANAQVYCNQWTQINSVLGQASFLSLSVKAFPSLALLNHNNTATVLFGQNSTGSFFAVQIQDGQKVSDRPFKLNISGTVSITATNADSNDTITLLAHDSNSGKMYLVNVRHDYCGNGISNSYEYCDGPECNSDCTSYNTSPFAVPSSGGGTGGAPTSSNEPTSIAPSQVPGPQASGLEGPQGGEPTPPQVGVIVPAVVIPVVVVAAGLIILLVLLRRRKKRKGSLLHGKSRVEIAMDSIDDRLKIPYKSLVFKKEIGAGSYGKVYVGEWKGTPVAIKVSSSVTDMDGFFDEARITVGLQQHPNVVQTFGVSLDGQLPCIVLEFCEGGSLDNRLFDSDVTMTQQQKIALIKGIARGLYHLHTNNIVHRDLAARNVLLNKSGTPKISDFGMSRVLKSEAEKGKTKTNYGPIRWMAPESLRDLQYSTKSDVWSFGIVLYEVVSRNEPHIDVDPLEVAVKIKNESYHPSVPQNVEPVLREIMLSCWQPDPNNRPSMEQICNKLNTSFPDD